MFWCRFPRTEHIPGALDVERITSPGSPRSRVLLFDKVIALAVRGRTKPSPVRTSPGTLHTVCTSIPPYHVPTYLTPYTHVYITYICFYYYYHFCPPNQVISVWFFVFFFLGRLAKNTLYLFSSHGLSPPTASPKSPTLKHDPKAPSLERTSGRAQSPPDSSADAGITEPPGAAPPLPAAVPLCPPGTRRCFPAERDRRPQSRTKPISGCRRSHFCSWGWGIFVGGRRQTRAAGAELRDAAAR